MASTVPRTHHSTLTAPSVLRMCLYLLCARRMGRNCHCLVQCPVAVPGMLCFLPFLLLNVCMRAYLFDASASTLFCLNIHTPQQEFSRLKADFCSLIWGLTLSCAVCAVVTLAARPTLRATHHKPKVNTRLHYVNRLTVQLRMLLP